LHNASSRAIVCERVDVPSRGMCSMKFVLSGLAAAGLVIVVSGCQAWFGEGGIRIVPYSSEEQMQNCQQYASSSYCEREMWGGHP
jgi:hypothetical protein